MFGLNETQINLWKKNKNNNNLQSKMKRPDRQTRA